MRYLLDTNVISELIARQPNQRVIAWVGSVDESLLYLSVITIGEIKRGIERLPASPRKESLAEWLTADLLERFQDRIVLLDIETLLTWGELAARLEALGRPMSAFDSLIAAQSLHGDFTLVTRNIADFEAAGVSRFDPFKEDM
jgi:tRNA(fMet)-specific endonuclease VapC